MSDYFLADNFLELSIPWLPSNCSETKKKWPRAQLPVKQPIDYFSVRVKKYI